MDATIEDEAQLRITILRSEAQEHEHRARRCRQWADIIEGGLGGRNGQTYTQHPSVKVEGY